MHTRMISTARRLMSFILMLTLLLGLMPAAQAASDSITIRSYDVSRLRQGQVSVTLTSGVELNNGNLSIEVGGVQTQIKSSAKVAGNSFLYIIVADLSAPYYFDAQAQSKDHAEAVYQGICQLVDAAGSSARFAFVTAGTQQQTTDVKDNGAWAKSQAKSYQQSITQSISRKDMTANLETALTSALRLATTRTDLVSSVILVSDCGEVVSNISDRYIAAGVPLHCWALNNSKKADQRNSEAGRKSVQNLCARTGGTYAQWDIAGGLKSISLGEVGGALRTLESGTRLYELEIPKSDWGKAHNSTDQSITVRYSGAERARRVAKEINMSVLPSPTPQATVTVTPRVIRFGERADEVRQLQTILKRLGYYTGAINDTYDAPTRSALQALWRDNESQDPEGGYDAWTPDVLLPRLQAYSPRVTPAPEVMALSRGNTGEYVTKLQDKLFQLGYFHRLKRSDVFDNDTQTAITRFCQDNGIQAPAAGVTEDIFARIMAADPKTQSYKKPDSVELRAGDKDDPGDSYVARLQDQLYARKYLEAGYTRGEMDQKTLSAVRAIAADHGWQFDGKTVTTGLQAQIAAAGEKTTPTPEPTATPEPDVIDLTFGQNSKYVGKLQNKLAAMGFYHRLPSYTQNLFDAATQEAVGRFCDQLGQQRPAGGCNANLFSIIMASNAVYRRPEFVSLQPGERDAGDDTYVQKLQEALVQKGYLQEGYTLGALDERTLEAVAEICQANGWDFAAEEGVSADLQASIKTAGIKTTPTPVPTATPAPETINLHPGDKSAYVVKLQDKLSAMGFFHRLKVNSGVFDEDTQTAVDRFCDQISQAKEPGCSARVFGLILASNVSYNRPVYLDLTPGEKDPDGDSYVRNLQTELAAKGYLKGAYTPGTLDENTMAALRELCADNGLIFSEELVSADLLARVSTAGEKTTPTPEPTATPAPEVIDLRPGDVSAYVTKLQDKLSTMGFFHRLTFTSGVFDNPTQTAVNRFCDQISQAKAEGCSARLFSLILASDITYSKPAYLDLTVGETDPAGDSYIQNLQTLLFDRGYLSEGYSVGALDEQTVTAIYAIAEANHWTFDGVNVTAELQSRISTAGVKLTPTPEPTATPAPEVIDLHLGDVSGYVTKLQDKLSTMGFFHRLKVNTGVFDADTQAAVDRFCDQISQTKEEEGCSARLFSLILNSNVSYVRPQYIELTAGSKDMDGDAYIKNLQADLKEKGYLGDGYAEGTLDELTIDAVVAVCEDNGWDFTRNGVSVDTQQRIHTASAKVTPTPKPDYIRLDQGAVDAAGENYVRRMQERLNELGYYDKGVTPAWGTYDEATAAAVKLFKEQNSQIGDGSYITEGQLRDKLFGENHPRSFTISEQVVDSVTQDTDVMGFSIPIWAIIALVVVLIFAILAVILVASHRRKAQQGVSPDGDSHTPGTVKANRARPTNVGSDKETEGEAEPMPGATSSLPYGDTQSTYSTPAMPDSTSFMTSTPGGTSAEDASTVSEASFFGGAPVQRDITFSISYMGRTDTRTLPLGNGSIVIGRNSKECELPLDATDRTLSRRHCEIYLSGGNVMVRNLSSSEAGTILNGVRISLDSDAGSEDAATMGMDAPSGSEAVLHSGDVLSLGRHTVTVTF